MFYPVRRDGVLEPIPVDNHKLIGHAVFLLNL